MFLSQGTTAQVSSSKSEFLDTGNSFDSLIERVIQVKEISIGFNSFHTL